MVVQWLAAATAAHLATGLCGPQVLLRIAFVYRKCAGTLGGQRARAAAAACRSTSSDIKQPPAAAAFAAAPAAADPCLFVASPPAGLARARPAGLQSACAARMGWSSARFGGVCWQGACKPSIVAVPAFLLQRCAASPCLILTWQTWAGAKDLAVPRGRLQCCVHAGRTQRLATQTGSCVRLPVGM